MTLRTSFAAASLALAALAGATPAFAHHSASMYNREAPVEFKGVVKLFAWTNPHCTLTFVTEPQGATPGQEWVVEMTSPGVLTRTGWTKRSLNPGDRIAIKVAPLRTGGHAGGLMQVTLTDTGVTLPMN